jgi:NAD(P)-dependent dehydrogenase (short-subunit alcohol dehydrogenase family)
MLPTQYRVQSAVQTILKNLGQIDCVIANAGFGVVGDIADLQPKDFARQFDVKFYGVLYLLQATLGELRRRRGRIGIVGSVNAVMWRSQARQRTPSASSWSGP